jgi:N-acetylneuraminate synthase
MKTGVSISSPRGGLTIENGGRCFVIAEAGTSHNGDISRGRELVAAAAESGADCVKFQAVFAEEILHPSCGEVPLPGGPVSLYRRFEELEAPRNFYEALKAEAENRNILFLCTGFGPKSFALLEDIGVSVHKVASPELNYTALLTALAECGKPVILSTGVSLLGDIERAVELIPRKRMLLHCITAYPAPEEEYNLAVIPLLNRLFGLPVGVSDHSEDPLAVPLTGSAHGAALLEKHLRLDGSREGLDDPIALDPGAFSRMVKAVRGLEEVPLEERSGGCIEILGRERFLRVTGDGVKRLAPAERANYGRTNRSIHAVTDLEAGTRITETNTAVLRTEKKLDPGLHPRFHPGILGARLSRSVAAGQGITWRDVLDF